MADLIKRYMHQDGQFRVIVASTTEVGRDYFRKTVPSPIALQLLVQGMTGVALLAATLKDEGSLQLKFSGDGPIQQLVVESNTEGHLRGFAEVPGLHFEPRPGEGLFQQAIGAGQLSVKRLTKATEKYFTSVVPLVEGEMALNLANYLLSSEQIQSGIQLGVSLDPDHGVAGAGGVLIQAMPDANELLLLVLEDRLSQLPGLGRIFAEEKGHEQVAALLFEDLPVKLMDEQPLSFRCNCSRERMMGVISALPVEELESLQREGKPFNIRCHFCQSEYECTEANLGAMIRLKQVRADAATQANRVPEVEGSVEL